MFTVVSHSCHRGWGKCCVGSCASRTSAGGGMPIAWVKVNFLQQRVMNTRGKKGGRNCV